MVHLVRDDAGLLPRRRNLQGHALVRAPRGFVTVDDARRLASLEADAHGRANLDLVLFTGHREAAIGVVFDIERRAADSDGRGRRHDTIVVVVALADQARDRAHAAPQQVDQETIALGVVVVRVAADREKRVRPQRHEAAIREPDLHTTFRAGRDRVAGLEGATALDLLRHLAPAQRGVAGCELGNPRRGVRRARIGQSQGNDQDGILEPERGVHGVPSFL
jgi:hypothetical protein